MQSRATVAAVAQALRLRIRRSRRGKSGFLARLPPWCSRATSLPRHHYTGAIKKEGMKRPTCWTAWVSPSLSLPRPAFLSLAAAVAGLSPGLYVDSSILLCRAAPVSVLQDLAILCVFSHWAPLVAALCVENSLQFSRNCSVFTTCRGVKMVWLADVWCTFLIARSGSSRRLSARFRVRPLKYILQRVHKRIKIASKSVHQGVKLPQHFVPG